MNKLKSLGQFCLILLIFSNSDCNNKDKELIECSINGKVTSAGSQADLENVVIWISNISDQILFSALTNSVGEFEYSFNKDPSDLDIPIYYTIHLSIGNYIPLITEIVFTKDSCELIREYSLIKELYDKRRPYCFYNNSKEISKLDTTYVLITCYFSEEIVYDITNFNQYSSATFKRIKEECTTSGSYIFEEEQETDIRNSFFISFMHKKYDKYNCDTIRYNQDSSQIDTVNWTQFQEWKLVKLYLDSLLGKDLNGNSLLEYK